MNRLCRISQVRNDLAGLSGVTSLDGALSTAIDDVSAEFANESERQFFCSLETAYFVGAGKPRLLLDRDLVSVTTLKVDLDRDGVFETTLVADTDYYLWPYNPGANKPYRAIELNPLSTRLLCWHEWPRFVQLTGLFGYSFEKQSVGTLGAAISSTTATSLTMAANHDVQLGDTLVIDDEQLDVTAVSTNTVTVTRGINGTTAATHLNAAAVYCRRYPRDIEMAVAERVVGLRWDSQGGYSTAATLVGDATGAAGTTTIRASYARWRRAVERYSLPVVG